MRAVVLAVAVVLAAVVTGFVSLMAYSLTAEYGTNPNRGGASETVGWVVQFALPAVLVVMVVLYAGSVRSPLGLRRRLVVGGGATVVVAVSVAVLLGAHA